MRTGADQRSDERVEVILPVYVEQNMGMTRDFSANGIRFDTDGEFVPGNDIDFILEVETFTDKKLLKCKGRVVRAEAHDGRMSVAASVEESTLEPIKPI
ncbi:peptidase M23 [Novimethylophilus kurashikiensis]|uniref:Peptidase M23 n=1 Tax=Novimethylophilus kurashikiensis TaxID=1825523 RepID=A0A2R5F6X3_9PROT|nr:PilZ domain-containing protein [Novimethylophilus kurashikiensis]GBG13992.1 peptidase M23 [Novimethylophilus kurashikiensis]